MSDEEDPFVEVTYRLRSSLLVRLTSEAALRDLTPEIVVAAALDDLLDHLGHCNDPAHCHIIPPGPGTRGGVGEMKAVDNNKGVRT